MCSVDENDFCNGHDNNSLQASQQEELVNEVCKKCLVEFASVKIGFKDALCGNCFVSSVRHKFRAALGATRIVPRESSAVLVFDGGPESCLLLDVVATAISLDSFKRLHLTPFVLYVDEMGYFGNKDVNDGDNLKKLKSIKALLDRFNFKSYYTTIADADACVEEFDTVLENLYTKPELTKITRLYKSLSNATSRLDFIKTIRRNAIIKATHQLNCKYAFVAEIGSDLAKTFMTNIVLGKGATIGQDISFADFRADVVIIRPLRELTTKEVEVYVRINGIEPIDTSSVSSTEKQSIQHVTDSFIEGLQTNFTGSISTIFKTGNKINSSLSTEADEKCIVCRSTLDRQNITTLTAIEYSRYLSMNAGGITVSKEKVDELLKTHVNSLNTSVVCHGCYNIFIECCVNDVDLKQLS